MKKYFFCILTWLSLPISAIAQAPSFTPFTLDALYAYGMCAVDMDGDYLDDIVMVTQNNLKIYRQLPDGGFMTTLYPVAGLGSGYLVPDWSIAAGDFDNNGFTDLAFGNNSRAATVKANATGTAYTATTYPMFIFSQRSNFVDIDSDGLLDLFVCHDIAQSHSYRNDGEGHLDFDLSLMPTLDLAGNYASIWTDYNNDGLQDMYLSKCRGGAPENDPQRINLLYKNNGDGTFEEVGQMAGVNDGAQSWSTAIEDFDNDGDMDMIVSNISDENRFYLNNNDGTFSDGYDDSGIAPQVGSLEIQCADFDNDGWIDFLWQNNKELYLNNGDNTFTGYDLDFSGGALADLNNDGFIDVQFSNTVYFNDGNNNNWLKVTLQGVESNRNGIGARVEIYGPWGKQIRDIRSGTGFSHMNTLNAHFGIGAAETITSVVVRWPSGKVDEILGPQKNSTVFFLEGANAMGVEHLESPELILSPNPVREIINFNFGDKQTKIVSAEIFDLTGRSILFTRTFGQQIVAGGLSTGTYILRVEAGDGRNYTSKFIKE